MLKTIFLFSLFSNYFVKKPIMTPNKLYGIKIIDHDIENKTVYEKFEYYSMMQNEDKAFECLKEIFELSQNSSNGIF
jgi:hypothetical protein